MSSISSCSSPTMERELRGVPGAYTFEDGTTAYAERYRTAAEYLDQGRFSEAEEIYRDLMEVEPGSANAQIGLGSSLFLQDRYPEAITAYKAALDISPESTQALIGLGSALSRIGDHQSAADAYAEAISIEGNDPRAHWGLGITLERMGRLREALEQLERVIELAPGTNLATYAEDLKREIESRPE